MTAGETATDLAHGFDFLSEPVLIATLDGRISEVNAAAQAVFGADVALRNLGDIILDHRDDWLRILRFGSGSTAPRPGKLLFDTREGAAVYVVQVARSKQAAGPAQVILRLIATNSERFAMLDRQVKHLDSKLHEKLRKNAELEEALRQNQILLRELQHRVKNNIQLIMSLTKISAQGHDAPEVAMVVATLRGRLQAMAAAQEALYQAAEVERVPAQEFLRSVVITSARAMGASKAISMTLDEAHLSSDEAHSLALIANELITNAAKYGLREGQGNIRVTFAASGADYRFEVTDDGVGINQDAISRSSGLALVRGLCRQIGGRLDIDGSKGTRCTVIFRATTPEEIQS